METSTLESIERQTKLSRYPRGSLGHVLDYLRLAGIVETIAGYVTVGEGRIMYGRDLFAEYKYFSGIEEPLFLFVNSVYAEHRHYRIEEGVYQDMLGSNFHLSLSSDGGVELVVRGYDADPSLAEYLSTRMFGEHMTEQCRKLVEDSGAVFSENDRGGDDVKKSIIVVTFGRPENAQAFIDYLNGDFVRPIVDFYPEHTK